MTTWAVLATGPSMNQDVADAVRGRCKVAAVSDSIRLAPWAEVLVSADRAWWDFHGERLDFAGPRYGVMPDFQHIPGMERFKAPSGTNSGLLAVMVAVSLGATKVLLCGVDLHSPGDHFFGRHPKGLKSTPAKRLEVFEEQFARYRPQGVEIVNCSERSQLLCYRFGRLEDELSSAQE